METLLDVSEEQHEPDSSGEEDAIVEDTDNSFSLAETETEDNGITSKMTEDSTLQADSERVFLDIDQNALSEYEEVSDNMLLNRKYDGDKDQSDIDRKDKVVEDVFLSEKEEDEKSIDFDEPNNAEAGEDCIDVGNEIIAEPAENTVVGVVLEVEMESPSRHINDNDRPVNDTSSTEEEHQETSDLSATTESSDKLTGDRIKSLEHNDHECPVSPQQKKSAQLVRIKGKRELLEGSMLCEPLGELPIKKSNAKSGRKTKQSSLFTEANDESQHLTRTPKNKQTRVGDLLANFVEYKDQIPPSPSVRPKTSIMENKHRPMSATKGRQSWPMSESKTARPSTTPLIKPTRQLGSDKRISLPRTKELRTNKSYDPIDYDIPSSLIKRRSLMSPKTPESQRSNRKVGLNKNHSIHELHKEKPQSRATNLQSMPIRFLSTAVKIFCATCIIARCLTFIGGKRSFLHYLVETPIVWIVRFYILIFHAVLILVEMRMSIPGLLPQGTLNNFVHRAYVPLCLPPQ